MRPNQRRGQRAREIPSVAEIDRRAEEPPRPRHPILDIDRHRVQHRNTQWLPQQHGFQHGGDHLVQNDPNTYRDGQRRYQPSVTGRIGPHAPDRISTPSLHNHHGTPTHTQHVDPQYPCPQCTGPQYPGPQYPGPQYPGPQYPGSQYPGTQPAFPQQIRGLDSTYRPNIDEHGTPRVNDYFPPLQEVFGRFPPTFNDQMFAGPPEPQAGIPNSMAAFDSTSFQQGYNAPYFLPNLGYGGSSHGQGVSPDPFRSLLSTPYLLPAPLLGTPNQQPALTQDSHRFPSQVLPSLATTHEQTRSRAMRDQGGNVLENQTTVDPRDLNIVQHNLRGPLAQSEHHAFNQNERNDPLYNEQNASNFNRSSHSHGYHQSPMLYHPRTPRQSLLDSSRPADHTPNIGKRHGAKDLQASAASDPQSELTHLVSQQQLRTPTRPRVPYHQGESHDSQGQGSEKRKRRDNSSLEDGSSPSSSTHETNPKNGTRLYSGPRQENQSPTRAQSGKHQDQARRLIVRLPHQSGILSSDLGNERDTGAMVEPGTLNAVTGLVGIKQQRPYRCDACGKSYGSRRGLQHHHQKYCKREDQDKKTPRRQTLNSPEAGSELGPSQIEILPSLPSNDRDTGAMVDPETLDAATETVGIGQQKPYPCDTCGKRYGSSKSLKDHYRKYCRREDRRRHRRQTLNPPEAESGLVMTDHERPAEIVNRVLAEGHENGEQQLVDKAENPNPLAQDSGPPSTPPRHPSAKKQSAVQSPFFTELDAYNGVVTPSKLEPGEAPRVPSWSKGQQHLKVGAECPICGVRFGRNGHLQQHFVACAKKNGNPDGCYWDELLEDQ